MAEIQEYLPQTTAQEPVGGVSPNIELAGATGRAIERIGNEVSQAGTLIHRRQAQRESADVYEAMAMQRANATQDLQEQIKNGTLDVDKFMESYDKQLADASGNITTPEAQNLLERQGSRIRGYLLKMANAGSSQIAYNEELGKRQQAININSNTIETSPDPLSAFKDIYDSHLEQVDQDIQNGTLKESSRSKAEMEMGSKYAESAIRGLADINPDKARIALHDPKSPLVRFLSPDQRHKMENEIDKIERDKEVDKDQEFTRHERAMKLSEEAFGRDFFGKIQDGSATTEDLTKAVKSGKIREQFAESQIHLMKENVKQPFQTDPVVFNDLARRIVNETSPDHIDSSEELASYVGKGGGKGITLDDYDKLARNLKNTPEQKEIADLENTLFQAMKSVRYKNQMTGGWDENGEQKWAQAKSLYWDMKAKASPDVRRRMLDPNDPMYFGKRIDQFQTSPQEQIEHQMMQRTTKANGQQQDLSAPPVKSAPAPEAKREGETALQNLFRSPPPELQNLLNKKPAK